MPVTCFCFEKVTIKFKKEVGKHFVFGCFEPLNFDHNKIYTFYVRRGQNLLIRSWEFFLLFPFWLPLEHGASMKLSVSLQFLNLGHSV
jgi:hypothetical protein